MTKPDFSPPDPNSSESPSLDHKIHTPLDSLTEQIVPEADLPQVSSELGSESVLESASVEPMDDVVLESASDASTTLAYTGSETGPETESETTFETNSETKSETPEDVVKRKNAQAIAKAKAKIKAKADARKNRKPLKMPSLPQVPWLGSTLQAATSSPFARKVLQFRQWPWFAAIGLAGTTSLGAFTWLSTLPPVPNCDRLLSTWTDSERLYCADQAARKQDASALAKALAMVSNWDEQDPVFEQASKLADNWSLSILDVAQTTLEEGKLKEAIALAEKVPKFSTYYDTAQGDIKTWKADWKEGEKLLQDAGESIQEQNWALATDQLRQLVKLDGEHWQKRADKLISEMTVEQGAFRELTLADDRANYGTTQDIESAIKLATQIDPNRLARKRIGKYIDNWSEKLVELADYYYKNGDYQSAIEAARAVPPGSKSGDEAQAFLQASQARNLTKEEDLFGYMQAIALIDQVPKTAKVLDETEPDVSKWEDQVQSWSQVQFAKLFSRMDQGAGYEIAIQQAALVKPDSPRRIEAQSLIAQWDKQRNSISDRQAIARATALAKAADLTKVQAAIAEAQKIKPDSPFRNRAQALIAEWEASIERKEDQPLLDQAIALAKAGNLDAAINTADKIGPDRALYDDAQDKIADWVADLQIAQDRPILNDAEALARNGQLSAAITRASEIGYGRALYFDAQKRIGDWAYELDRIAAANRPPEQEPEPAAPADDQPDPSEPLPEDIPEPPQNNVAAPPEEDYVDSASGAGESGGPEQ